jgi:hypothetical protein
MTDDEKLDRTFSIRLPLDLIHRLEKKLASVNTLRAKDHKADRSAPLNFSDVARRAMKVGLDVLERNGDAEEHFEEIFGERLLKLLASGYRDAATAKMLKKIAASMKPELDFG